MLSCRPILKLSPNFELCLTQKRVRISLSKGNTCRSIQSQRLCISTPKIPLKTIRSRLLCTFRQIPPDQEMAELEDETEILGEEIPLVESHWESYQQEIRDRLAEHLQATDVEVFDITKPGCGIVLEIRVASNRFAGLTKVNQSRLVSSALQGLVDDVHALTIKTSLPAPL